VKVLDSSHVEVTEQFFACGVSMADSNEGDIAAETAPTATIAKLPDLVWDEEAPGLCIRVHGNGTKSFLFVYRMNDRQRLLKLVRRQSGGLRQPEPVRRNCVPS
jgi:hypothetical protein